MPKTIGENIKDERLRRNWSVEYLGNEADISGATISRIENNQQYPRVKTLRKIEKAFEKSENYFYPGKTEENKDPLENIIIFGRRRRDHDPKFSEAIGLLEEIYDYGKDTQIFNETFVILESFKNLLKKNPRKKIRGK